MTGLLVIVRHVAHLSFTHVASQAGFVLWTQVYFKCFGIRIADTLFQKKRRGWKLLLFLCFLNSAISLLAIDIVQRTKGGRDRHGW